MYNGKYIFYTIVHIKKNCKYLAMKPQDIFFLFTRGRKCARSYSFADQRKISGDCFLVINTVFAYLQM